MVMKGRISGRRDVANRRWCRSPRRWQNRDVSTSLGAAALGRAGRRRLWWLVPELAALCVLVILLGSGVGQRAGEGSLHEVAAERAARALEQVSPTEHHDHGHDVGAGDRIYCGVLVFGVDPTSARYIDEVKSIYGYYFCAVGRPGVSYLDSSRSDGPIVVRVTDPPTVEIVASGEDYQDRVRAMMPDQYEDRCFGGLPDLAVAEEVKRRYEAELA